MATVTKGKTFGATETVTNTKLHELVDLATITDIVDADVGSGAAISESKIAVITTGSKVNGSSLYSLSSTPSGAGLFPAANLINGVPTGTILLYGGATAPTGYLLCYGQEVSRTTYATLYALVGDTFGAGDSSTTFNVPDLRGRFPLGKDNLGGSSANRVTDTDADTIGGADGDETKDISHSDHSVPVNGWGVAGPGTTGRLVTYNGGAATATASQNAGSGGSTTQDVMPPFITLAYIIKY